MVSFAKLWEQMQEDEEVGADTPEMEAIRTGLNQNEDFWDQFLLVCNNSNALATLLGVRPDQVSSWHPKVQKALDKVRKSDDQPSGSDDVKKEMLPTGDDGPPAHPAGSEAPQSGPDDIRPY